jgi:hypothetical protein
MGYNTGENQPTFRKNIASMFRVQEQVKKTSMLGLLFNPEGVG